MDAVLLDTDVFSFLIRRGDSRAHLYQEEVRDNTVALSFVSVGELYVWVSKRKWGAHRVASLEEQLRAAVIVPFDLEL